MGSDLKNFFLNWKSSGSFFISNPRLDRQEKSDLSRIQTCSKYLPSHLWLQSSGSTQNSYDSSKWIALSKEAFLVSAHGVNMHLESNHQDVWGLALPLFHVGGLSIYARSFLSGAKAVTFAQDWQASSFHQWVTENKITLLSLVPTQLFDLVRAGLRAPSSVRAVVIGGAKLESKLAQQAWVLGWPILASFGMTEVASQVATAPLKSVFSDELLVLGPHDVKTEADGRLQIKSEALMTGYAQIRKGEYIWTPVALEKGYFKTADQVQIKTKTNLKNGAIETFLVIRGRVDDFVKINGEGVDLTSLRSRFFDWLVKNQIHLALNQYAVVDCPDARQGTKLLLAMKTETTVNGEWLVQKWNEQCFPIERLELRIVGELPLSELGKVQMQKLRSLLL